MENASLFTFGSEGRHSYFSQSNCATQRWVFDILYLGDITTADTFFFIYIDTNSMDITYLSDTDDTGYVEDIKRHEPVNTERTSDFYGYLNLKKT